ncbi:MAG: ATP-binding protein [Acidobacteriota bacterium]
MGAGFVSWRRRSRRSFALVAVLGIIPVLLLWLLSLVYFKGTFEDLSRNHLRGVLELHAGRLRADLEQRAEGLRDLIREPQVRASLEAWDGRGSGPSAERLRAALEVAGQRFFPLAPVFVGRGLERPVVAGASHEAEELDWATLDLPTGRRDRRSLRLVVDLARPTSDRLALAAPAPDPVGVWVGTLVEAQALRRLLPPPGSEAQLLLVRPDGIILGQATAGRELERLEEVASDRRRAGGWWRIEDDSRGEVFRLVQWLPVGLDLVLVAEIPATRVYAGMRDFHVVVGLVALLGLGLVLLGILVVMRVVQRPLEHLEGALQAVSSGKLPEAQPVGNAAEELAAEIVEGVRPQQESAQRWRRRAEQLESVAGRLSDVALIECGRDGRIRRLSAGAARLGGWSEGSLRGESLKSLLEEEDWERVAPQLFGAGAEVAAMREPVRLRRRTAESVRVELRVIPLEEPDEEGFLLVLREIAPQSDREVALAAAEARLRAVVEGIHDGVAILANERLEYANPALSRLLGRSLDKLIGTPFTDYVEARDLLPVLEAVRAAAHGQAPPGILHAEMRTDSEGGSLQAQLTVSEGAEPGKVLVTVRDVTGLLRAEAALALERRRLDLTLESTSDGILAVQYHPAGTTVMLVNRRLAELFALKPGEIDELSGREAWLRLGEKLGLPERWAARRDLFGAPSEDAFTERFEAVGEAACTLEVFCGPIRGERGQVVGRVATFRDISAQRRAETALRDQSEDLVSSRDELERAYHELEIINQDLERRTQELTRLNRELRSLDELKTGLLANVSHELQTPLVSVKGYTEMILKEKLGPLTEQQRRGMDVSLKNINRLIGLIDNLLSFSRMEGEMAELKLEVFPLRALLEEVLQTLGGRAKERQVEIFLPPEGEDLLVKADRDKISQVLLNLLSNAIKFNRPGGKVWVEADPGHRGYLKLEVRDTGIGIPREALDKIFERFYQVDASASRRHDGTGIGLSIVKNILHMHGCMIRADSAPGEGSVFSFTLPAARRARPERTGSRSDVTANPSEEQPRARSRPSRPLRDEPRH